MLGKELLKAIWNLERTNRPGIIIEETYTGTKGGNLFQGTEFSYENEYQKSLQYYNSIVRDRDDNIVSLNSAMGTYVIPTAFGAPIRAFEDGHRYIADTVIKKPSDVDGLKRYNKIDSLLSEQIRLLEYIVQKTDGNMPIRIPDIQNPLGVAEMLWETNDFYMSLIDEPQRVHKLLEMVTEAIIDYISSIKNICKNLNPISWPWVWAPAEKGVYLADDTMSMVSPQLYEEYGVYYNNIISREFGGLMLHSCTTNKRYFNSIMKNEGLRSINFAAQYSSDLKEIFDFFGGKVVVIPHYVHTDSPQIGTVTEFIEKVMSCWRPETPAIIYISSKPGGGIQQEVFDKLNEIGINII